MKKARIPIDFVPNKSKLKFLRQTTKQNNDKINPVYSKAIYKCVCGIEKELDIGNVKSGKVISCGCYGKESQRLRATKHGLGKHPLMRVWSDMKSRCYIPNRDTSKYYIERGVKVCDEWINNYKAFYDWAISNGWEKGLQLDKDKKSSELGIENNIYSPQTCCFLTPKENSSYRISNRHLEYNGIKKTVTQWEEYMGLPHEVILQRIKRGWDVAKAITTPLLRLRKKEKCQ